MIEIVFGRHVSVPRAPAHNADERHQHGMLDILIERVRIADAFDGDAGDRGTISVRCACEGPNRRRI